MAPSHHIILAKYNSHNVSHVDDAGTRAVLNATVDRMVKRPVHFREDWLREHNWRVILVSEHIDEERATLLQSALLQRGICQCFVASTSDEIGKRYNKPPIEDWCFHINTSKAGLLEFADIPMGHALLFPESKECAVLTEQSEFFALAGTQSFVEQAAGMTLPEARQLFRADCNEIYPAPYSPGILLELNSYYSRLDRLDE